MLKNGQKLSKIAKNIPKKATYIHLWPVFLPPWVHFASNHLSPWSEMNISGHWGRRYFSLTPAPTVSCHFFLVSLRLLLRRPRGSGPSATRQATPAHCATRSFGGTLSRCFGHESRPGLPPPPPATRPTDGGRAVRPAQPAAGGGAASGPVGRPPVREGAQPGGRRPRHPHGKPPQDVPELLPGAPRGHQGWALVPSAFIIIFSGWIPLPPGSFKNPLTIIHSSLIFQR